jgi:hypothetical protein
VSAHVGSSKNLKDLKDVPALCKDIMARNDVGLLAVMATSAEGQIGALLAASFCEGMYSRTENAPP